MDKAHPSSKDTSRRPPAAYLARRQNGTKQAELGGFFQRKKQEQKKANICERNAVPLSVVFLTSSFTEW